MANVKITELSAITTTVNTDVLPIVSDPGGTPITKKITAKDFSNYRRLFSIVPAGNFSLTAGTSLQAAFPTTGDTFTLLGSTTYRFEGKYYITKSGTTTTIALSFVLGGGASITSIHYVADTQNVAVNTTGAVLGSVWVDQVAATVVGATASTAAYIRFGGLIRMNAGGTVVPSIQFSAAPTTPVMVADSYIIFDAIGTNTENILGSVA